MPGFATPRVISATDTPAVFMLDNAYHVAEVTIVSTAVDAGSSPTTQLRAGLALGKITTGGKYVQYIDAASDGSGVFKGFLLHPVNMKEPDGVVHDQTGIIAISGYVNEALVYGLDANGKADQPGKFCWSGDYH